MHAQSILKLCVEKGLYKVPSLNETLYLHYGNFERIENLDAYTEVRVLWLESNRITKIENLDSQVRGEACGPAVLC
jgi:dynein assembly factor 1